MSLRAVRAAWLLLQRVAELPRAGLRLPQQERAQLRRHAACGQHAGQERKEAREQGQAQARVQEQAQGQALQQQHDDVQVQGLGQEPQVRGQVRVQTMQSYLVHAKGHDPVQDGCWPLEQAQRLAPVQLRAQAPPPAQQQQRDRRQQQRGPLHVHHVARVRVRALVPAQGVRQGALQRARVALLALHDHPVWQADQQCQGMQRERGMRLQGRGLGRAHHQRWLPLRWTRPRGRLGPAGSRESELAGEQCLTRRLRPLQEAQQPQEVPPWPRDRHCRRQRCLPHRWVRHCPQSVHVLALPGTPCLLRV